LLLRKYAQIATGFFLIATGLVLSLPGVPGPGILIMLAGLAVLSRHYHWARRLMEWARRKANEVVHRQKPPAAE
jgi:hypothetical protein